MRKLLMIAVGMAALGGGVALAQMPPGGPDGQQGMQGMQGMHGMGQQGMGRHERWEMMEHEHDRHGGGAAAFRFRKGDMEVGIKCSDREPTQACVSAASALLDKLNAAPKTP